MTMQESSTATTMKFRSERDVLSEALGVAGRAAATRGGLLPVLSGVRLELSGNRLTVTGSDQDLTISVVTEVAGASDGVVVIPAKLASDVVRSLRPGAVELSVSGDEVRIEASPSDFKMRAFAADQYPEIAAPAGDGVTLEAEQFRKAIDQVEKAASTDDARPILTGVLLSAEGDGLRLVSTDSYRLSLRDLRGTSILSDDQKVLVPSRALKELSRLLGDSDELELFLGERDASFVAGETTITTRLIEGDFPNYRGLIPENHPNRLSLDRESMLEAVKRVRLMAQDSAPVRLTMSESGLDLTAITQEVGQAAESVDASYSGENLTVAFNADYLIDGIEVAPGDEISLETVDELKPALLKSSEDESFLYLLMPVRVS